MKYLLFTFLLLTTLFSKEIKNITVESSSAIVNSTAEEAKNPQVVDVRGIGLMIGIKVKCDPGLVQKEAIKKWGEIFGSDFPTYG